MNKVMLTSLLLLVGCGEDFRSMTMEITSAPARRAGVTSDLVVPRQCPIYTPTGSDIDTPELPFQSPILFDCGVDGAGDTYGLVTGDTGDLAVLVGGREIGVFFAFDNTVQANPPTMTSLGLDGPAPHIRAWSAPDSTDDPQHCCAEDNVDRRIPFTVVAIGPGGILLSFGQFDRTATQVAIYMDLTPQFTWMERFYVNGAPPVTDDPSAPFPFK